MKICEVCHNVTLHTKIKVYGTNPYETEGCQYCGALISDEDGLTYLENNDMILESMEVEEEIFEEIEADGFI